MKKITFKELIELIEQKKEPKEIIVESTKYKLNGSTYYDEELKTIFDTYNMILLTQMGEIYILDEPHETLLGE